MQVLLFSFIFSFSGVWVFLVGYLSRHAQFLRCLRVCCVICNILWYYVSLVCGCIWLDICISDDSALCYVLESQKGLGGRRGWWRVHGNGSSHGWIQTPHWYTLMVWCVTPHWYSNMKFSLNQTIHTLTLQFFPIIFTLVSIPCTLFHWETSEKMIVEILVQLR